MTSFAHYTNVFPHPETTGLPRLLEALATNDWESSAADALNPDLDLDLDDDADNDPEGLLQGIEDADGKEMRVPMIPRATTLKAASANASAGTDSNVPEERERDADWDDREEGEEDKVETLQTLLLKMQAVKDLGADMSVAERRKLARRAVREVMRDV